MTPKIDTDKLVTVSQAARLLKISPAAVYKAIKRGRIQFLKLGRVFLIERADVISYREQVGWGATEKAQITHKQVDKSGQVLYCTNL